MSSRASLATSLARAAASISRTHAGARTSRFVLPQLSRQFAKSAPVTSTYTHSESTSYPDSSSPSTSNIRRAQQGPSRSTPPDASTLLLLNTIPSIPEYGFTKQAYLRSTPSLDPEEVTKRLRILTTLFPGPDSAFDSQLFRTWSRICDLSIIHSTPPEQILASLIDGVNLADAQEGKPIRMQRSLTSADQSCALSKVTALLEERLRLSWEVKGHLMYGLSALSTLSPTASRLHSVFPHETILPNLPNPAPLLNLSSELVSMVLTDPIAQRKTGWIDPDGPSWYTIRSRLTLAYTMATLHAASPSVTSFQDTQALFQRVVRARDAGLAATVGGLAQSGAEWVRWGGRGWLGILRSLGL
ncbi:uncharacterized protein UDID_03327 [Ustilago sp. UG-2017a]|nr:uncharacterized protein UDID_03327 [Ustilago sp. UG-2017a]